MSHAPRKVITLHLSDEDEFEVMTVQLITISSKNTLERMALCKVCNTIKHWWPKKIQMSMPLKPFFPFRDELKDGIIMNAVIPQTLEWVSSTRTMQELKRLNAEHVMPLSGWLWQDIDNSVQSCSICNALKPRSTKWAIAPPRDTRIALFCIVATDICDWNSQQYLVDSYSRWFEINPLRTLSSQNVINKLKSLE